MEPNPENVSGEVVRKHSFEHRINWGHVALGLAAIYVAYHVVRLLDSDESDPQSDTESDLESAPVLIT